MINIVVGVVLWIIFILLAVSWIHDELHRKENVKTELLIHAGADCSLWEVINDVAEDGSEQSFLRCQSSGDKIAITIKVAHSHIDDGHVHWENECLASKLN